MPFYLRLLPVGFFCFCVACVGATPVKTLKVCAQLMRNRWSVHSLGAPHSVQEDSDISRHPGERSYRFELRGGEVWDMPLAPSFRSEIETGDYVSRGSVQWYGMSLRLPKDFPIENNRLVLGQWWAKTKTALGELDRSPSLAQRFVNGKFHVTVNTCEKRVVRDLLDCVQTTLFETQAFPLGQWNDLVYQVKWSPKKDGFANIWLNGKQVARYSGPVGYDDDIGPNFKFGIYRDETDKTYIAHFDRIKRGSSFEAVDPARR